MNIDLIKFFVILNTCINTQKKTRFFDSGYKRLKSIFFSNYFTHCGYEYVTL